MVNRLLVSLERNLGDLAEHDRGVAVEEGDAGEAVARLEVVNHERVLGLEDGFRDFVGLERHGGLELLATGFLAHLEDELGHLARGAAAAHERDGGVAGLELAGDVEHLDLGVEVLACLEGGVLLVDHYITGAGHVDLVETLDVHANVVTRVSLVDALVVHLDGEYLTSAGVGDGVRGDEHDIFTGADRTLFNAAREDITDTLDLVHTRDGQAHVGVGLALGLADHVVEHVEEGVDVVLVTLEVVVDDVDTGPPAHVRGLLNEVVSLPAGDGEDGDALFDVVLLPANLDEHVLHLVADFFVAGLLVASGVAIHLVDADDELLDTEKVDETRMLAGLALDLTGFVVTFLDRGGEVAVGGHHEKRDVGLRGAGDHVFDEVSVARGVDDGVVPVVGEELLGGAGDGHTTLALFLLAVHVEREREGRLAERISFGAELFDLALGDASELENKAPGGGRLTRVDVTADHDGKVFLAVGSHIDECEVFC